MKLSREEYCKRICCGLAFDVPSDVIVSEERKLLDHDAALRKELTEALSRVKVLEAME